MTERPVRAHTRRTKTGGVTRVRDHSRTDLRTRSEREREAFVGDHVQCPRCAARVPNAEFNAHWQAHQAGGQWPSEEPLLPGEESELRELELWLENNEPLYRREQQLKANYRKKIESGTFDKARAKDGYQYVVDDAAKSYDKEFGTPGSRTFSPKVRRALAERRARKEYPYEE